MGKFITSSSPLLLLAGASLRAVLAVPLPVATMQATDRLLPVLLEPGENLLAYDYSPEGGLDTDPVTILPTSGHGRRAPEPRLIVDLDLSSESLSSPLGTAEPDDNGNDIFDVIEGVIDGVIDGVINDVIDELLERDAVEPTVIEEPAPPTSLVEVGYFGVLPATSEDVEQDTVEPTVIEEPVPSTSLVEVGYFGVLPAVDEATD